MVNAMLKAIYNFHIRQNINALRQCWLLFPLVLLLLLSFQTAAAPYDDDDSDGVFNGPNQVPIGNSIILFIAIEDNCIATPNPDQADFEGDGLGDVCDDDDNNDGIVDTDYDGDGLGDIVDLDDNGDGIADTDFDGDGLGDVIDPDDDNDGTLDVDNDGDGLSDPIDIDDDNDGLPDVWELLYGFDPFVANGNADPDGDGLSNLEEYQSGNDPLIINSDSDVDNDGVKYGPLSIPIGVSIVFFTTIQDNCPYISNSDQADYEGDGLGDICDDDDNNDGIVDTDFDSDGLGDLFDLDDNGDGILDTDFDGDLLGDKIDPDDDNDGTPDVDNDADGLSDPLDPDDDNDGLPDDWEILYGFDPFVANGTEDPDVDGETNLDEFLNDTDPLVININSDVDNDGIQYGPLSIPIGSGIVFFISIQDNCPFIANEDQADYEEDGIGDVCDDDDNNDGIVDTDFDGDGLGDLVDLDDNGDGVVDTDFDGDLLGDEIDSDDDNDGIVDTDTDGDGFGNVIDNDDDNDGIPDFYEIQNNLDPLVANSHLDLDQDGFNNLQEFINGTDPQDSAAHPEGVAGLTPGEFSVDASGGANYQVPIAVPPGTGGMQPSLNLSYNSRSGNGVLGVGWSLGGLSVITRCPTNNIIDGFIDGVDFDENDRFCIDGQRLIQVTGVEGEYGADGIEYRTETDGFTRVISYGAVGDGADKSPESFKVWTKSGQIMEYGYTEDSRIEAQGKTDVRLWAVNRIEDTVGNYLSVNYIEDNIKGEYQPDVIDYTGNDNASPSLIPFSSVQFVYEARTDITPMYFAGSQVNNTQRLSNIQAYVYTDLVRDYQLTYDNEGAADRSRLTEIQECNGAGDCFSPTSFNWIDEGEGALSLSNVTTDIIGTWSTTYKRHLQDFNGDGITDYMMEDSSNGTVHVFLGQGDGKFALASLATDVNGVWSSTYKRHLQDFNGDGITDYMMEHSSNGTVHVFLGEGDGTFSQVGMTTDIDGTWSSTYKRYFQDFNGDGIADYMMSHTTNGTVHVFLGEGDGTFSLTDLTTDVDGTWSSTYTRYLQDFNGDGITDYAMSHNTNGTIYVFLGLGDGTFSLTDLTTDIDGTWSSTYTRYLQDFNGDGITDYMMSHSTNGTVHVFLGLGDGTFSLTDLTTDIDGTWSSTYTRYLQDFNGDGITDYMMSHSTNGTVHVFLGQGDGTFSLSNVTTDIDGTWSSTYTRYLQDFNGDGITDYMMSHSSNGTVHVFLGQGDVPDIISSVNTALGTETNLTYTPITDNTVYTKGNEALYPEVDIQGPVYVISTVSVDDGLGGTRETSYTYSEAKSSVDGRGFLGFKTMSAVDVSTGIKTTTTYSQTYPYIGLVERTEQRLADDTLIGEVDSIFDSLQTHVGIEVDASHPGVWFPFADTIIKKDYELDGGKVTTTSTTSLYDGFGNPTDITVEVMGDNEIGEPETFTTTTDNAYFNDESNWFLGRLLIAEVTQTIPGDSEPISQTRVSSFAYSSTTGLLSQEVIEPNIAELRLVTDYNYDGFGNKVSVTVSGGDVAAGTDIASRSTTSEYDTRGQFAISTTNALGHSETRTYDDRFGVMLSLKGPNNITTNWTYDSFGRQFQENRADGTETKVIRLWCDGFNGENGKVGCPSNGVLAMITYSTGAPTSVAYSDALGRAIRSEGEGFDGTAIYTDTHYDALGRIEYKSRPYFVGTVADDIQLHSFTYDITGRLLTETAPDISVTTSSYAGLTTSIYNANEVFNSRMKNARGEIIYAYDNANNVTSYEYDAFGNLESVTDVADNITSNTYDVRGRKISMSDPDMGNWSYEYNALGELIKQTDAKGQIVTMSYDLLGRMTSRTEAEGISTWTYDTADYGVGKLSFVSSAEGKKETYVYDSLGRLETTLTNIDGDDGPLDQSGLGGGGGGGGTPLVNELIASLSLYYDGAVDVHNYSLPQSIGQLDLEVRINGTVTEMIYRNESGTEYTHTEILALYQEQAQLAATAYATSQTYDSAGRVETLTYPASTKYENGLVVRYVYNTQGYLSEVENDATGETYWTANSQNAEGQLTQYTFGNGVDTEQFYDVQTGRISNIATGTLGNNNIQDAEYSFDVLGNLMGRYDCRQSISETFDYDILNRMTDSTLGTTNSNCENVSTTSVKSYDYNAIGNITYKDDIGNSSYRGSYDYSIAAGPHAVDRVTVNGASYNMTYDNNGNQLTGWNFTSNIARSQIWNSYNKVKTITQGSTVLDFSYSANRSRFKQVNGNKTTLYIGGLYEKETDGSDTNHIHYIKAGSSTIAVYKSKTDGTTDTEELRYMHRDHIGSVTAITDEAGLVVEQLSYDPHGKRREATTWEDASVQLTTLETVRGFTNHEMLDDVGLIHMNGRVYDPDLGRFISADPFIQEPLNSQSLNRYSYVLNNPLSYTDPSGYFFGSFFKSIFKAIKSVVKAVLKNKVLRTIAAIGIAFIPGAQTLGVALLKGFAAGFVASGGDFKMAIIGAVTAGAFHGVGTHFGPNIKAFSSTHLQKIVAHGLVGGTANKLAGGKFISGFLSAGTAQAFAPSINGLDSGNTGASLQRTTAAAVAGGTASVLGGGKFASGAVTGAFSRLFNDDASHRRQFKGVTVTTSIDGETGKHSYIIRGEICSQSTPGCNMALADRVFAYVNKNDVPFTPGEFSDLGNGRRNLLGIDPIYHYENVSNRFSINIAQPGHNFYPGSVTHRVHFEGGSLNYDVTGIGTGTLPGLNRTAGANFNNGIGVGLFKPGVRKVVDRYGM